MLQNKQGNEESQDDLPTETDRYGITKDQGNGKS
jgi:hypothetical protein